MSSSRTGGDLVAVQQELDEASTAPPFALCIFVLNHFDVDSLPARILGDRHFEYNHASLVIFSKKTMARCLNQAGFEVIFSQNERQYASLGRIADYLKQDAALQALRALRLHHVTIPVIVPGTIFSICRKRVASSQGLQS